MKFSKLINEQIEAGCNTDAAGWERLLDLLPEGSELIVDETGCVQGVTVPVVYMFRGDNTSHG